MDGAKLQISLTEGERWRRTLSVTVPADVVRSEENKVMTRLAKRLKLPGFRKGRIPPRVLEQRFGPAVRQETLDKVIGDAYRSALQREELTPISEGDVREVQYEPDQDLSFEIAFDVRPDIELSRLGGFVAHRPVVDITDEQVEQVLGRLREQKGTWVPLEEGQPAEGNLVSVELLRIDDAEAGEPREPQGPKGPKGPKDPREPQTYEFVLGQGDALADVEAAIRTLSVGDTDEFGVTFPEDFDNEELRGQTQKLRIELTGRKELELPELDDDFAISLGAFESVQDLTDKVRQDLQREADNEGEGAVRGQLLDAVLDANPFDVPVSMTDQYINSVIGEPEGIPEDTLQEMRVRLRPDAERAVKRIIVLDRVAESQDLRATEEEVDERVETMAEKSGSTPAKVYAQLQKSGQIEPLEREITEGKVFEFLKGQSEVTEARE